MHSALTARGESSLRDLIEERAKELQQIEEQRKELEENLGKIEEVSSKISKEIRSVDNYIGQLNYVVQSNTVEIEKLDLEIQSLGENIEETKTGIENKKETIARLFTELQQKEHDDFLSILLRNRSLAEGVEEIESITNLNNSLSVNLAYMKELKIFLEEKVNEQSKAKTGKEVEKINLINRQYILEDQKKEKQVLLSQTKSESKVYEDQLEELQKIQDEISEAIGKMEDELRKTIDPNFLPLERSGVLLWPVPEGVMTQGYARTPFAIKNYKSQHHNGIDIGRYLGAEIVAAESGTVINVGNQDAYRACRGGAYGKFIVIKHNNGLTTLYGHMSRTLVSMGQKVERGELIGYMGRTGWATGPHLHFSVFASQTLTPAKPGFPEGTQPSRVCGPMPVGGDLDPTKYF